MDENRENGNSEQTPESPEPQEPGYEYEYPALPERPPEDEDDEEPLLRPSTYVPAKQPRSPDYYEAERAKLDNLPTTQHPDNLPLPKDPRLQDRHLLVTVSPGSDAPTYLEKRALAWVLQKEKLAAESDDPKFVSSELNDLLRLYVITRGKPQKAEKPQGGGVHNHQHIHSHLHNHGEAPDLAGVPAEQLHDLIQAFSSQVEEAKSDPRRKMSEEERDIFERIKNSQALDVEARELPQAPQDSSEEKEGEGDDNPDA